MEPLKQCETCRHYSRGVEVSPCLRCSHVPDMWEPRATHTFKTPSAPDDNPKTAFGLKKPAMSSVPPTALIHLSRAMSDGRKKYGHMNWREKKVSSTIYYDAAMRHLMAWFDGEETAEDSGVHHLGHAMACLAIILDASENNNLNDDRPTKGKFAELVKQYTEKM